MVADGTLTQPDGRPVPAGVTLAAPAAVLDPATVAVLGDPGVELRAAADGRLRGAGESLVVTGAALTDRAGAGDQRYVAGPGCHLLVFGLRQVNLPADEQADPSSLGLGGLCPQRRPYIDRGLTRTFRPDLIWVVDGRPPAVINAKYKTFDQANPSDDDLQQVITYCVALGVDRGSLVHATAPSDPICMEIRSTPIVVTSSGVDLGVPLPLLRSRINEIGDDIAAVTVRSNHPGATR